MATSKESVKSDSSAVVQLPFLYRLLARQLSRDATHRDRMNTPLFAFAYGFVVLLAVWQTFFLLGANLISSKSIFVTAFGTGVGAAVKASRQRAHPSDGTDAA